MKEKETRTRSDSIYVYHQVSLSTTWTSEHDSLRAGLESHIRWRMNREWERGCSVLPGEGSRVGRRHEKGLFETSLVGSNLSVILTRLLPVVKSQEYDHVPPLMGRSYVIHRACRSKCVNVSFQHAAIHRHTAKLLLLLIFHYHFALLFLSNPNPFSFFNESIKVWYD